MMKTKKRKKNRLLKTMLIIILLLIVAIACAGFALVNNYYHANTAAELAMQEDGSVRINQSGDYTVFVPDNPTAGIIFYPGDRIEYSAYAPLMKACAEQRIMCVLVRMPVNMSMFNRDAADAAFDAYPDMDWYIAGHSLGGVTASAYAAENADRLKGLILLASYSNEDLSGTDLRILSVYGSEDGVLNMDRYSENRPNLGDNEAEVVIEGGCHAGFGSYGEHKGDGAPTIDNKEQIRQTVQAIRKLIAEK